LLFIALTQARHSSLIEPTENGGSLQISVSKEDFKRVISLRETLKEKHVDEALPLSVLLTSFTKDAGVSCNVSKSFKRRSFEGVSRAGTSVS